MRKGFVDFLKKHKPDFLAIQEVKIAQKDIGKAELDFPGYEEFWNSADRPGYSGTAILIREDLPIKTLSRFNDIGVKEFDTEGRVQTIELPKFYFVNAYFPNTRHDLSRLDFKLDFNKAIFKHIKKLEKNKPVIFTGDFNVAHEEIDLANPKENDGHAGFHPKERNSFDKFLNENVIDTYRTLYPKRVQYTWWSYRSLARARNIGWRIDYFLISKKLKNNIKSVEILDQVSGSDHCPIELKLEL